MSAAGSAKVAWRPRARARARARARLLRAAGILAALWAWASPAMALASPEPERGLGVPRDASTDGFRIDALLHVTTGLTAAAFVFMCGWIVWAALRHNERRHEAVFERGESRRAILVTLAMAGLVFFVIDGYLFFNSTRDLGSVFHDFGRVERDPRAVRIEINAHQWAWDARYPGPDGRFNTRDDIVTLNDIRVPVDAPILLQVASTDVIHAFNLPNFRTKIDAVPGQVNRIWFQAKTTGEFDVGCAQHCGAAHYKMKAQLTVLPREEYERWAREMSESHARGYDEADEGGRWGWEWQGI